MLGDPPITQRLTVWVRTTHQYQATLMCKDKFRSGVSVGLATLITIMTASRWEDRRGRGVEHTVQSVILHRRQLTGHLVFLSIAIATWKREIIRGCGRGASCDTITSTQSCDSWAYKTFKACRTQRKDKDRLMWKKREKYIYTRVRVYWNVDVQENLSILKFNDSRTVRFVLMSQS